MRTLILDYPWYYVLFCLLAGLGYAIIIYLREWRRDNFSKPILLGLAGLRFASASLICLLLLNIFIKRYTNETEQPVVILAKDNSASLVMGKDSVQARVKLNALYQKIAEQLSKTYQVRNLNFGSTVRQVDTCDFKDKETDFSTLFSEVDNNYANENIGALVLISDGIYNKGANPVFLADKWTYPIYTVLLGDTAIVKDAVVHKVNHNQVAYIGNKFPVEVVVNTTRLKTKGGKVSITQNGVVLSEQSFVVPSDNYNQTFSFLVDANKPGVQRYTVQVSAIDGEVNLVNNRQTFIIDVIDNREKILLLGSAAHPDLAALKESIESGKTYEVEVSIASSVDRPLKPYSLVIFHGYSSAQQPLVASCRQNNIPYWMINPQVYDGSAGLRITNTYNKSNDAEPVLQKAFGLFTISTELQKNIAQWPAIKVPFGNYQLPVGASVLIAQKVGVVETDNPLFFFMESNGHKTALFTGDGLWRWKMRDFSEHENFNVFNELISKTVQYLSVKSDKSFFRISTKKVIAENELAEFTAEVYNKSYEAITDPDVTLKLTNEAKQVYNYTFSKTASAYYLNAGLLAPGDYRYEAKTVIDGRPEVKVGLLSVKAVEAEQLSTVANHQVLHKLSTVTSGKSFYPDQYEALVKAIEANELIKPVTYTSRQTSDIIHIKWLFALVLGLLATEWFIRKRNGSI